MKHGGLALLIIGVGMCAAFGSRLAPDVYEYYRIKGAASFAGAAEFDEYCGVVLKAGDEGPGASQDGCVGSDSFQAWDGREAFCKELIDGALKKKSPKLFSLGFWKTEAFTADPVCGDSDNAKKNQCSRETFCADALTSDDPLPGACYGSGVFRRSDRYEPHCEAQKKDGAPLYTLCKKSKTFKSTCTSDNTTKQCKPDRDAVLAEDLAGIKGMRDEQATLATAHGEDAAWVKARGVWITAFAKGSKARADAAVLSETPPMKRFTTWFSLAGLPFFLGLILIVVGAIIARKAHNKSALEASDGDPDSEHGPIDFGVFLAELTRELETLAADMASHTGRATAEDIEGAKTRIEALQSGRFEPLVDARGGLQVRHGLAAFAAIFSPLSGAERRTNRAWSALVDDHWPEATSSIQGALDQARLADAEMKKIVAK